MAEVERLLTTTRLLTLTGPGGIGKTRLAFEVARAHVVKPGQFAAVVELAGLVDPALVANAVAVALTISEQPGRPLLEVLSDALAGQHLLLVLDNCEHLVTGCAELADRLLHACPDLRVLATSREALGIDGETVLRVPPLAVPELETGPTPTPIAQFEAVQLFVDRARAVVPSFCLTDSNVLAIVHVCRRLDGIPLALELAAARVSALSVQQIAERLDAALRVLVNRNRLAQPRQQTLRATLDWSHALLDKQEQQLFERLSVFSGGWTLEAAEAVCAGAGIELEHILDVLARLVEKSLVVCEQPADGPVRYRLLETVRQYGQERLAASGATEAVEDRHATYFLEIAEAAAPDLFGPHDRQYQASLTQLELEHENLRAALRSLVTRGDEQRAQRLGGGLRYFWFFQGHLNEGRAWLAELVAMPESGIATVGRAAILSGAAILAVQQGDYETTRTMARQAEALWRQLGNDIERGLSLFNLGSAACVLGDRLEARAVHEEALRITRAVAVRTVPARTVEALNLYGLSELAFAVGDYADARARADEALAIARDLGWKSPRNTPQIIGMLGDISVEEGDLSAARAYVEDSLSRARAVGWGWGVGQALIRVAHVAIEQDDLARTVATLSEAFAVFRPQANRAGFVACLEGLAHIEARRGNAARTVRLTAEAAALRKTIHVPASPTDLRRLDRWLAPMRASLGERDYGVALAQAGTAPVEQVIATALVEATDTGSPLHQQSASHTAAMPLTQREQAVVALVAQGLTNIQIAEALVLSTRTVESHVRNALGKLHLSSRVRLATWAIEHQIVSSPPRL